MAELSPGDDDNDDEELLRAARFYDELHSKSPATELSETKRQKIEQNQKAGVARPKAFRKGGAQGNETHKIDLEMAAPMAGNVQAEEERAVRKAELRKTVQWLQKSIDVMELDAAVLPAVEKSEHGGPNEAAEKFLTQGLLKPRCYIAQVEEEWLPSLGNLMKTRLKMLVLDGPSHTGKTFYARQLAEKKEFFFETNCAGKKEPDVTGLCATKHRIALFDECHAEVVLSNRWAKRVNTWGLGIVVASNNWEAQVAAIPSPEGRAWLKDNTLVINVARPLWIE